MSELAFDLKLRRANFPLDMTGTIPLHGVTAIMGPSGSGKTSLLMMLAGLEPRARGEVTFGERVWARGWRRLKPEARRIGVVFQDGRLFPHLTVADNIAYGARRRGVPPATVHGVADALAVRHLLHRRPPTLSGGEVRRVALARAMASAPDILFLDEPLSGLDDTAKAKVLPYVARAVAESGVPAIYVTHSRSEVTRLADRVLEVADGKVTGWGQPPAHLDAVVDAVEGDRVTVAIGRARLVLRGHGARGDARRVAFPQNGLFISRDRPGPSGARAIIPAEITRAIGRPGGVTLVLSVDGQQLTWPVDGNTELAARLPEPGTEVWLSVLDAHLR